MRLHWHHRSFREERFDVLFVDRLVGEDGRSLLGFTDFDENKILINARQDEAQIGPTLVHEYMHALAGNGSCERFIRTIDVGLWQAIEAGGFRMPKFPRGLRAFRERAMFASGEMLIA